MRKTILATLAVLTMVSVAFAGTISDKGIYQKDLYILLNKLVTMVNELKADHNGLVADMTASSGIKAQFGTYSTAMKGRTTSTADTSLTQ